MRNVGSDPSSRQLLDTQKTSLGKMRGTMQVSRQAPSLATTPRVNGAGRSIGSMEGYMHAPSTLLAMNNTGYLRHSNQVARNTTKDISVGSLKPSSIRAGFSNARRMTEQRFCGKSGTSAAKLHDIMKVNKLF